ncbi:hypothetical protein COOONC_05164 [Cooperia oncophora]
MYDLPFWFRSSRMKRVFVRVQAWKPIIVIVMLLGYEAISELYKSVCVVVACDINRTMQTFPVASVYRVTMASSILDIFPGKGFY